MSFFREVQMDESFGPFASYRESFGFVPNLVRAQTLLPRLIEANERVVSVTLIKENALSRMQKARMALCVAETLQDRYSMAVHGGILRFLGMAGSQIIQLLKDFREVELSVPDVALLEFCVKLSRDGQSIGSGDVERLRSCGLDEVSILETVLVCAVQSFLSVASAGLRPEPDFEPYKLPPPGANALPSGHGLAGHGSHPHGKTGPYIRTVYLSPTSFAPFAGILKTHGFIPNVFRAQSLRPDVLEAAAVTVGKILMPSDILTRVQKEAIFVAASAAISNSYCVAAHCNLLRGLGLSPQDGDQIALDHHQSNLPDSDKTLLDFAVKLASRPSEISLVDVDRLRTTGFRDEQILECIALTALSSYINTIRIGLGVEPDFELPPGFEENKVHLPEAEARLTGEGVGSSVAVEDPDAGLVTNAKTGDLGSFEKLIRRHSSTVYRTLMAMLGNQGEAEDAMQEAFLSAFTHIGRFEGRAKFSTWLVSIARNTALQRLRSRKNVESLDEIDQEGDSRPRQIRDWHDNPEQLYSQSEIKELVEKGILGLPSKYRVVLMLRDIEQLPTEEVARQLGLSVPATKARLLRGRLMLRESLAPHFTATAGKAAT